MSDDGFLLLYPVFLIGKHPAEACQSEPSRSQAWATAEAHNVGGSVRALMVFTETEFAERVMIAETIAGNTVPVSTSAALADIVRRNRRHFAMVLIDPIPDRKNIRGWSVDEFLRDLER